MTFTFWDFLRFFIKSFELPAVDRSLCCHFSPGPTPPGPQSHNLHRHRSFSCRRARGCVSNFLCPASRASVYRSTCLSCPFFSHGLLAPAVSLVCYSAATLLAPTSSSNVYWLEIVVDPAAQRFGERASASRTFSYTTDLANVQREVNRLFVFIF